MKKTKILLSLILGQALSFQTACTKKKVVLASEGETTIIKNFKGTPEDLDNLNEALYILAGKMMDYSTYQIEMTGVVDAEKGIISQRQEIDNVIIKNNNEVFFESISNSIIKSEHQAFIKDNKVAYRMSVNDEYDVISLDEYSDLFGVVPCSNDLFGYILNDDTILSAVMRKNENSTYIFEYQLDVSKSTPLISKQTKEFGGLNDYPSFKSLKLVLTVDKEFNPVALYSENSYSISKSILGNFNCVQKLNYKFEDINGLVSIPDSQDLNAKIESVAV